MDQPKPSSISQPNLQSINEKICPALQKFFMNLARSKLLQNSLNQDSSQSQLNFGLSSDSSTASSPLSPSLLSTDSSNSPFLLSSNQFQSPNPTSISPLNLNLNSLMNFNLSLATKTVLNAISNSNKRPRNNSQNKSNSKNASSNLSLSSESSCEIEPSISTTVKTKKKKSAFKFDNRKYIRRSFTPMCDLLVPIKVPTEVDFSQSNENSLIKQSSSFILSENEFNDSLEKFDLVKSHQILELYEARIQMGQDDIHLHPALAIKAADEQNSTVFSKEEIKRFDNYGQINVYQPRPNFWPSRVWDTQNISQSNLDSQDDKQKLDEKPAELNEQQSEKLQRMIEDSYKIPEIEVVCSTKSTKPQKKRRPRRMLSASSSASGFPGIKNLRNQKSFSNISSTVFNLHAINVITDDSDFDTDFEEF